MAISNHHALSEATCISRARRFKSSLGHRIAGHSDQAKHLTRCLAAERLSVLRCRARIGGESGHAGSDVPRSA